MLSLSLALSLSHFRMGKYLQYNLMPHFILSDQCVICSSTLLKGNEMACLCWSVWTADSTGLTARLYVGTSPFHASYIYSASLDLVQNSCSTKGEVLHDFV